MDQNTNSLNWFEIPALDLERSKTFYETLFDIEMMVMEMDGVKMAMFPMAPDTGKANGALAQGDMFKPGTDGVKIYLNANPNMENVLVKVASAGGKIILPKTNIGGNGFMAFIEDTEGNHVGIHSNN